MNNASHSDDKNVSELRRLLAGHENGGLDQTQVLRVRELLRTSSDCRSAYIEHQLVTAALAQPDFSPGVATEPQLNSRTTNLRTASSTWSSSLVGLLALATVLLVAVAARWVVLEFDRPASVDGIAAGKVDGNVLSPVSRVEATDTGVAVLAQSVDAVWASELAPESGETVPTGTLKLDEGLVQLEFFCGATVVIEAPAIIELLSPLHAYVHRGKLRAQVPPAARGFKLDFHDTKLTDLGTEFAIDVDASSANVHVFDGEVEIVPSGSEKRLLVTGQAIQSNESGEIVATELAPDEFVGIAQLEQRSLASSANHYRRWRKHIDHLRNDPRLVALYTFDGAGDWRRRLPNQANMSVSIGPDGSASELDGAIVGAERADGRWSEKSSLEFKRSGDRVRIAIPGEFSSLSFSCWAKIDSLDRWFNSLFLTDGYNAGEPHWQILNSGRLYFSVLPTEIGQGGPRDFKSLSQAFWKPSMSGKWLHLVTTYDVPKARITHYLNGQQLSQESVPEESLVPATRIGAASIGNWSQPTREDAQFAIRNLNGSIDELAIFSAALSADEVKEIYEHGKP